MLREAWGSRPINNLDVGHFDEKQDVKDDVKDSQPNSRSRRRQDNKALRFRRH